MIGFSIKMPRVPELDRGLRGLSNSFNNLTALNKMLGIAGVRWVTKNFQREGDPKWQRLLPATANARIRKGSPRRRGTAHILVSEGLYKASFASNATSRGVRIGSPWKLAKVHEEGRGHMPKRQVLPTRRQASEEILKPVTDLYIKNQVKKAGLKLVKGIR